MNNLFNRIFHSKRQKRLSKKRINPTLPYSENYSLLNDTSNPVRANNYHDNVIVHKCVNLVSQTSSHVPWKIYRYNNIDKVNDIDHPLNNLLKKPNYSESGADFFVSAISNLLLYGNTYILASGISNRPPRELYLLPSQYTDIVSENGIKKYYRYRSNNTERKYSIDSKNGQSVVLHLKNYNPNDALYGLSSLRSASNAIEMHNLAAKWNISLLKNNARPSGALVLNNDYLSDEQFLRLQEELNIKYSGASRAGRPLLLEGGMDWKEMSINPKDMDFIETRNTAAREIALAFGVPPQLLGITGDNTYSNMQEARLALWEETIIPLLDKLSDAFSNWFSALYNEKILVDFDRDEISALTGKREELWSRISSSNFITINEKRKFIGLAPIKGGDRLQ